MSSFIAQEIVDELLQRMEPIRVEMQPRRDCGTALPEADHAALVGAYVATLRERGWLRTVRPEELERLLEVLVLEDAAGNAELDVESTITGSVWSVPGWGVTETDPAAVGRGLAEDEADLLDDAREPGELTGWE